MLSFPVMCVLLVISAVCDGQHAKMCNVVPKDGYFEMGSNIEIKCYSSCVHGRIYWTLNNTRINETLSKTINSTYSILLLRNFTHCTAILQCHNALTEHVLGGTTIRTYSKPQNISCFLHRKDQTEISIPDHITCSWEHYSSSETNYSLCSSCSCSEREICSSNVTSCEGKNENDFSIFSVIVRAQSKAWDICSDPYDFDGFDIFKINRPVITVTVSSGLLVEWIPSPGNIHCEVKYSKVVNGRTMEWILTKYVNREEDKNIAVNIDNVESCINYTVSARCRLSEAPWSDWSQKKTVLSKLNTSAVKLHLWRKVTEPEKNGRRSVHAMWKEIPRGCQDSFNYTIEDISLRKGTSSQTILCGSSTCDFNVTQDAHRINLTIFQNGIRLVEDSIYIPAIEEKLPRVNDIRTSTLEGNILVSWAAPVQPVSGYMIDWTHNGVEYFWKETKYTNMTLFDLDYMPYNITVTPIFDDKTGRGTQVHQICSRIGAPGNVSISNVVAKDRRALVSWNMESQKPCSDVVVNYIVFYGTQKGPQLNITVDCTKQEVWLEDLKPQTPYSVFIMATAFSGNSTSAERLFDTKRFDPNIVTTVSVGGSIIIVLVLSLGLCCAVQWKKFKEKMVPNPGLSSVALWFSPSHQRKFQPFSVPTESHTICERVYPCKEDAPTASTAELATGCNGNPHFNPANDQTDENTDSDNIAAPDSKMGSLIEPVQTTNSSPGEGAALLPSHNNLLSPYRCQSSVEPPAQETNKSYKHPLPAKQQIKTAPMTVYVTLDVFEQGQAR
ncbi:hypothetical protein LDENG_00213880 [Lucifuga dentata]|nr:hypothetical protein LDENG_00213880 [Lucifuga dentata]